MNEGQLTRLLTGGNAWWRTADWERDDRDLRRLARASLAYRPTPLAGIEPDGLYVLRGPRRVGKSSEVKRAIAALLRDGVTPRQIVHFSCDELGRGDLQRLVNTARENLTRTVDGPRYWFLDEITSVPSWPEAIKWLRDNTAFGEDCVVLTGSSARDLAEAQKQLAGRLGRAAPSDRLLLPMGFRSFARSVGTTADLRAPAVRPRDLQTAEVDARLMALLPWLDELGTLWESYLRIGGFPRAVGDFVDDGEVAEDFTQALWDVTAGEAFRAASTSAAQAQAMLARLTTGLGSPLAVEALRRDMGVDSPHTARARLDDLTFAYLAWPCHRRQGDLPHLAAQSKYYFVDPLMARLAALRSDGALAEADVSVLSEQQLGLELLRSLERTHPGSYAQFSDVMYHRTSSKEVDFCGPRIGALGIEGKYVDSGWRREALTVRAAYGAGVLATRSVLDTSGDVWAVPAPFLAWMLNE